MVMEHAAFIRHSTDKAIEESGAFVSMRMWEQWVIEDAMDAYSNLKLAHEADLAESLDAWYAEQRVMERAAGAFVR